jgi:hypothetical protein
MEEEAEFALIRPIGWTKKKHLHDGVIEVVDVAREHIEEENMVYERYLSNF